MVAASQPVDATLRRPASDSGDRLAFANEALDRAWRRGWLARPSLEPDVLLGAARATTGLVDFGLEDGWRDRLHRLAYALHDEAALTPLGTTIAYGQLVAALAARLRATALWDRHPEITQVSLERPIIVVGQMRSGSTRMQRLLACDARFAFTRFYESWNPLPRWNWLPLDDRRLRAWLALRVAHWLNPKFGIIHPASPGQADEEIGLHNVALYGAAFEAQWRIPSFVRHVEATDSGPVYEEFRRHLQTIKWLRKGRQDKPWIMKLPQFSQDLDAVLRTFPGARVVALHRDPRQVVGSSASLVHNQMKVQSDRVDRHWIGRNGCARSPCGTSGPDRPAVGMTCPRSTSPLPTCMKTGARRLPRSIACLACRLRATRKRAWPVSLTSAAIAGCAGTAMTSPTSD